MIPLPKRQDTDDGLLRQALPLPLSIDATAADSNAGAPATAEEFLQRMVQERAQLPKVLSVSRDELQSYSKTKLVNPVPEVKATVSCPPALEPPFDWCRDFTLEMTAARQSFVRYRALHPEMSQIERSEWPKRNDMQGWMEFARTHDPCLSMFHARGNMNKWVIDMLGSYMDALEDKIIKLDRKTALWLYSLLVRLEKPLSSDVCALLTAMQRYCSKLRLNQDEEARGSVLLAHLNIILVIIERIFGQKTR